MKKLILIVLLIFVTQSLCYDTSYAFGKKSQPVLLLTSYDPRVTSGYDNKIEPINVFRTKERIYFSIYTKKRFKSDYIKYQIVKQDDNAHIGGYSRVMNRTVKVSDKNQYTDYIVLNQAGKYFIQIFDITDLQHWIAMGAFAVLND